MKVKVKEILKLVFVLASFVGIYVGLTIFERSHLSERVETLSSEYQELDIMLTDFTKDVMKDTVCVKQTSELNTDSLMLSINSYIEGNDSLIVNLVDSHFKDTSSISLYLYNLNAIVENHNELKENIADYTLYHNRLVSRFPSNLVVSNYKQYNKL